MEKYSMLSDYRPEERSFLPAAYSIKDRIPVTKYRRYKSGMIDFLSSNLL